MYVPEPSPFGCIIDVAIFKLCVGLNSQDTNKTATRPIATALATKLAHAYCDDFIRSPPSFLPELIGKLGIRAALVKKLW